jgi:hypothetical protein
VHEAEPGAWVVTHFAKRQAAMPVDARVRRYRERNKDVTKRYESCNGEGGVASSFTSTSLSFSDSVSSEEGAQGEEPRAAPRFSVPHGAETDDGSSMLPRPVPAGESPGDDRRGENSPTLPSSSAEAMLHPDVRVFTAV